MTEGLFDNNPCPALLGTTCFVNVGAAIVENGGRNSKIKQSVGCRILSFEGLGNVTI